MRKMKRMKRALVLALCAAMVLPMSVSATGTVQSSEVAAAAARPMNDPPEQNLEELKKAAKKEIIDYYNLYKTKIKAAGNEKAALASLKELIGDISLNEVDAGTLSGQQSEAGISALKEIALNDIKFYSEKKEEPQSEVPEAPPEPETTNSNIMVGGNWVTPVAKSGNHVSVVLPVVNMGRTRVKNAVVTPQISNDVTKWPFEIETSNYTQTIDRLPGTDDGGTDMERRRELTWVLKTRKDAPSGYMPLVFDVTYEKDDKSLEKITLTTYVDVRGTTGVNANGTTSTPRVIVTGFSTSPEVVNAGETFTLTLHMQNTAKATAVKNMLFDIQAASESTDTNYVAAAFLPTAGSSTVFVDQIPAGGSKDISMELEARSDLSQKPYVVNVKMNYEDENVNPYENTASVSIPVRQEARVDISTIEVMPEYLEVGREANVMFSIYNIGKTRLYNTNVKFIADSVTGGDTFLGNVDPGATANVDAYLTGAAATMDDGIIKIEISYEDESGEKAVIEKEMTLFVNEMMMPEDMGMMDPGMPMEESGGFKIWYVLIPLLLIILAVVAILVIRRRKKKKAARELAAELDAEILDELEEEEPSAALEDGEKKE